MVWWKKSDKAEKPDDFAADIQKNIKENCKFDNRISAETPRIAERPVKVLRGTGPALEEMFAMYKNDSEHRLIKFEEEVNAILEPKTNEPPMSLDESLFHLKSIFNELSLTPECDEKNKKEVIFCAMVCNLFKKIKDGS